MIASILIYIFTAITVAPIVYILITKNVIRAVFSLAFSFLGLSGLYVLLNAEFMAVVQLLIYAGGIIVLMVFGLMLTKTTLNKGFVTQHRSLFFGSLVSFLIFIGLAALTTKSRFSTGIMTESGDPVARIGQLFLTDFIIAFEVVAFLLLVALVGASYLAKKSGS